MAALTRSFCGMCPTKIICFVLVFLSTQCSHGKIMPSRDEVKSWADEMSSNLFNLNNLYIVSREIFQKTDSVDGASIKYEEIKAPDLVKEMAETLSEMLLRKMDALNRSVNAAEAAVRGYKWKQDLEISDVSYYNAKTMIRSDVIVEDSVKFGKKINRTFSSVHIPVEIYEGNIDILNGLNWTADLDEQFKQNAEEDNDILWQYFGSQTGFMRTFPATYWNNDGVDLYDVRRQSWYTQGSSSPKDMMILIDTSGSTFGQSLQLMKNAVKSILNTLGENDFVNVVEFSSEAKFVGKCFNHTAFVQANFRNKKQLEKDVDGLTAMGQADFSVAIKFAFEKFDEFSRNETDDETNMGANCNKVIMLLTDGGTDNAEDVFKKHNWPNKTVRVFTYAVGPTPNPIHAVRWMACANRGYFSQIPAMGAIRARVQGYTQYLKETKELTGAKDIYWEVTFDPREYIPVLSRPQVIKNKKTFEWGNIYEDHLGLGMMTTVTLPVYNNTLGSINQTILGVMGVDVTTTQLEAKTPFEKIGPNGYSFAINPNGYVVFHPNLKTQGKFMKEPPNIDLLELEVEGDTPELVSLRTEMIKGDNNDKFIHTLYLAPNRRYVSKSQATYAFIPIENTTFRLGISVPSYQKEYRHVTADIKNLAWPTEYDEIEILVAPWRYRNSTDPNKLPETLKNITEELKEHPDASEWNLQRLFNLYFDVKALIPGVLQPYLKVLPDDEKKKRNLFIMTSAGMTMVYPSSNAAHYESMRDVRKSSLFTRALYFPGCILAADYTEAERSNTSAAPMIDIACGATRVKQQENGNVPIDKPAVFGERITHDKVMDMVHKSIQESKDVLTCSDSGLLCYLVDDGGFLVATNRDDYKIQLGRFMGQVDPPLMNAMIGTIYSKVMQYDFQAACKKTKNKPSAGIRSFTVPTFSLLSEVLNVGFWTNQISWMFSSFSLYSWLLTPTVEVLATNDDDEEKECVKVITQYFFNLTGNTNTYSSSFQCDNCSRTFTAARIKDFNLMFIASDPVCEDCSDPQPPIIQAPREISPEEEEAIICELARNPRNRVQSYGCYHEDAREDQSECGCASLKPPRWLYFFTLLSLAWIGLSHTR